MRRTTLIGWALAIIAGVGAYRVTVAARTARAPAEAPDPATNALLDWLNVRGEQRTDIAAADTAFAADLQQLRASLEAKRTALAAALGNPETPDAQILAHVEAVIAADSALERRVAQYLLAVRPHLTSDQQRRLFGLCADGIRQGRGRQYRGGTTQPGEFRGRGMGPGGGQGRGMGGRWGASQTSPN